MNDKGPGVHVRGPEGSVSIPTDSWDEAANIARAVVANHDGVTGAYTADLSPVRR